MAKYLLTTFLVSKTAADRGIKLTFIVRFKFKSAPRTKVGPADSRLSGGVGVVSGAIYGRHGRGLVQMMGTRADLEMLPCVAHAQPLLPDSRMSSFVPNIPRQTKERGLMYFAYRESVHCG